MISGNGIPGIGGVDVVLYGFVCTVGRIYITRRSHEIASTADGNLFAGVSEIVDVVTCVVSHVCRDGKGDRFIAFRNCEGGVLICCYSA